MAASVLQSATNNQTATTITAALASTPTLGNTLVVIANSDSTLTLSGAGWTALFTYVNDQGFYIWSRAVVSSDTTTFTVTPAGGANYASVVSLELTGVTSSPFDVVGTVVENHSDSNNRTAASITTTAAGDLVLAILAFHSPRAAVSVAATYGNSFTSLLFSGTTASVSAAVATFVGQKIQATAGAVGTTAITGPVNAGNQAAVQIAFKAGSPGTPGNVTAVVATVSATAIAPAISNGSSSATVSAVKATVTVGAVVPAVSGATTISGGGVANVNVQAIAPVIVGLQAPIVSAVAATVTVQAVAPSVSAGLIGTVLATTATASVSAVSPVVAGLKAASITAVVAAVSVQAIAPFVQAGGAANVLAIAAAVSITAQAPVVTGNKVANVVAVPALLTVDAKAPTVNTGTVVMAVVAQASVSALAPTVTALSAVTINAVAAAVSLRAIAPQVGDLVSRNIAVTATIRQRTWQAKLGTRWTGSIYE